MLSDATLTADIIKQFAKNAFDSTMPFSFHYGTVKSTDPIEIEVEQKLILTENDLIFTTLVQDFDVQMYMEHETEKTDLIHNHEATTVAVGNAMMGQTPLPFVDTGSKTTIQNSSDEHNHLHEYKGVKTFTVNLKLAKDEKVLLLRIQGGQKFLVLDRVRTLNDTEFTNEFEGSGSSGSSGSGSGSSSDSGNTSGGGSGGSTDSGGGNSGSTDSGNGGNNSGSTDNENPDTGDNGNNSGGSVSDVISVTALMTALLSLTDEQKKEIGLTGVTIDDENITDSSTWSSQKIQDSVNANTFEISKLNETTELSGECCIPIVQGTETKKIKVDTLQSELNDKINNKVDKVSGKGLSTNDFTNEDKNKLADIKGVNLSNFYYYTAETGIKYYWYKIIDSSVFNATNRYIKLKFKLASDNNYPLKAEYILDVSHYLTSTAKNLSVSLKNIYADKDSDDSNIIIAVDENYNVYAQFCCQWESYVNITKEFGNINFISEKLNYASFNGEITNITPKQKVTRQGKFSIRKNLTSGVYTVDSVTDTISYGISSKAIADGNGNNIESTYLKKTAIDTSMNTESTNPVQNKVVTNAIATVSSNVTDLGTKVTNLGNQISSLGNKVYTCSTASGTKYKTVSIPNIDTPSIGTHITVVFTNGNSIAKPTLGINGTSSDEIRAKQKGQIVSLNSREGTSSYGAYEWQSNTTLDLYYNGTYWIVLNNPVVYQVYFSDLHNSYKVYADGWKEVTIKNTTSTANTLKVLLPIPFTDTSYFATVESYDSEGRRKIHITEKGATYIKINRVDYACTNWMIYAEGY